MYLQRLEGAKSSHRNWPTDCVEKPAALDNLFNICDDTLNSWKEVHDDFHELQGDAPTPKAEAYRAFVRHCHHALWCTDLPLPSKYGMEIVAHALLKVWIENHQKDLSND